MLATPFHGTPITPNGLLRDLCETTPVHLCVSFYRPDQVEIADELAASYFIDNGVFSAWMKGVEFTQEYWNAYASFVRTWQARRCSWHVIPDPIGTGTQELDAFIRDWPADLKPSGVPVFHTDEPTARLLRLIETHGRVCIGAVAEHRVISSPEFCARMDELWDAIIATFGTVPPLHMFRALQLLKPEWEWPFASVDSTNLARNHNRLRRYAERKPWALRQSVQRWATLAANRPDTWVPRSERQPLLWEAA